ncbi:hypothetical protein ADN00_14245 [Ornatilinea apprima]|uniref:DUF1887 domain-containing protein n=1 Tax=Ornatilinea apprima TaxID=1134406 RepID=A0A0P6XFX8_9CHLR|nr:DUF1887 family CARF protein [Ornatilinea apprima]KPL73728.1 hypothetical protein ADN00_14245 [Ornatilinea apprima]
MILLSLIGEQPIPNLLPLWQSGAVYTGTRFAVTQQTMRVAQSLREALARDAALKHLAVLDPLLLDAYDIDGDRRALVQAIQTLQERGEEVCVNLTGGTKLMSLAALQAAQDTLAPMLYVSTQSGEIIHLDLDGSQARREPIRVRVSVSQYLGAHGFETSLNPNFHLPQLRSFAPPKEGDPLENQVERLARDSGYFDDVQRGLFIRKRAKKQESRNELDLLVTRNGRLAVCSCKSGVKITKEMIYELDSIFSREDTGIYCAKVLVCAQEELPQAIRDRARNQNVHLVYGEHIQQIADVLLRVLR